MEIFFFVANLGAGGAERVCITITNELLRCGNNVNIVVLNMKEDDFTHTLDSRCKIWELGVSRIRYAAIPMIKFIKQHKVEKILMFGQELAVILNQLRKIHLIHIKIFVRVLNNTNITLEKEDGISPIVERILVRARKQMREMDAVIVQCDAMGTMLLEQKYVDKSKMFQIYNPASQYLVDAVKRNTHSEKTYKEIVFIGRLDPQKNIKHLLKAFEIVNKREENSILRLVGDGVLKESLQLQVAEQEMQSKVIFEGVRRDMEHIYEKADLVVLSSLYEGMPNCLIEAISIGIPVVAYDCPIGPKEIIVDGENGYLVEFGNINQLAERILDALSREWNPEFIKQTAEKFRVEKIAQKYLDIFEHI